MRRTIQSFFTPADAAESVRYQDRRDAGKCLAKSLAEFKNDPATLVLALPRGGAPVGYEVAERLRLPLDVFVVRKLGVPLFEELAMGAIATGGVRILNEEVIRRLHITPQIIEAATEEQQYELERREMRYRGERPPLAVEGKRAILVDDGLATGSSMRAAIQALRLLDPLEIIVAVPVGCAEICEQLEKEVARVVCGKTPESFQAVGQWYADFSQTRDEEVTELLNHAAHQRRVRELAKTRGEPVSELKTAAMPQDSYG